MNERTYTVNITGYASGGEGVARLEDGRVVFVRGAARGDKCEISITSERPRSCNADIESIIHPSEHRILSDCPHYPECGGCDFRHIIYEEELRAKLNRVNNALERIAKATVRAEDIISTGQINGYRNKAVFHIESKEENTIVGFYRENTNDICPIEKCLLLEDEINDALHIIRSNPPCATGSIALRTGGKANSSQVEINLDDVIYEVSQESFFQVNNDAALLLFRRARDYAALLPSENLLDIYCGVGSMTLFIGRDARYALGVESNSIAVDDARNNANRNGIGNVDFICADAMEHDYSGLKPDCIIVDPPRKGLAPAVVKKILEMAPSRIVYVSCDPATLSRDISRLYDYEATKISAVDMFPRTANVECCLLLVRR